MLWTVLLLAVVASAQGRAVNITNTWVLPEEGFPVFYHYFKDRISWYEADAVCQFHHANLVTVDTTAQYDAVRAYLKELDITSAVWVGLIRSNPDGDFTWTDYRGLSSDGYWSSAPDARSAPLCAAADPAADYRWEARACGGPTVASFICELPVPQWAQGNEGCMVRALPALTILYLPESASVQLTADCGMAGVKRVQCTGNVKRENLLKDLSCMDEDESPSSSSLSPASNTWPVTTDAISSAHDTSSETTSEDNITTNHDDDNQPITPSSINQNFNTMTEYKLPIQKINRMGLSKTIEKNLDLSNNLQSNYIPKVANDNHLSNEQLEKIEDEKHMQHKMLHEEIARLGNLENIFTQPTDHFVPPLVMAKAKISDDMTVLSLQEKHAQQFAEEHVNKHKQHNQDQVYHLNELNTKLTTEKPPVMTSDKPLVVSLPPLISKDLYKKEKTKSPKKYIEKLADPKSKIIKQNDLKQIVYDKSTELPSVMKDEPVKIAAAPTSTNVLQTTSNYNDDDSSMELTVLLKELPVIQKLENQTSFNYSGDVSKLEVIKSDNVNNSGEIKLVDVEATEEPLLTTQKQNEMSTTKPPITTHKVIKISIVPEYHTDATPTVFEITTNVPTTELGGATTITEKELTTESSPGVNKDILTSSLSTSDSNLSATRTTFNDATKLTTEQDSTTKDTVTETATQLYTTNITNNQTDTVATKDAVIIPVTANVTYKESVDSVNADHHEDYDINANSSEPIDDFQSPLLSAANEPLHRPNRSRRPQPPPNRNKFNPFRMLG